MSITNVNFTFEQVSIILLMLIDEAKKDINKFVPGFGILDKQQIFVENFTFNSPKGRVLIFGMDYHTQKPRNRISVYVDDVYGCIVRPKIWQFKDRKEYNQIQSLMLELYSMVQEENDIRHGRKKRSEELKRKTVAEQAVEKIAGDYIAEKYLLGDKGE